MQSRNSLFKSVGRNSAVGSARGDLFNGSPRLVYDPRHAYGLNRKENRAAGMLGHEGTPFRAVSMTSSLLRSFDGDQPALAVADVSTFGLVKGRKTGRASYLVLCRDRGRGYARTTGDDRRDVYQACR